MGLFHFPISAVNLTHISTEKIAAESEFNAYLGSYLIPISYTVNTDIFCNDFSCVISDKFNLGRVYHRIRNFLLFRELT